jgi:hypothetical protein
MADSTFELIGRIINPRPRPVTPPAPPRTVTSGPSLETLIGRITGPPAAARRRVEPVPPAAAGLRVEPVEPSPPATAALRVEPASPAAGVARAEASPDAPLPPG